MNEMNLAAMLQGKGDNGTMMPSPQSQMQPAQMGQGKPMPSEQEIMMAGMVALGLMPPPGAQERPRQ